LLSAVSQFQALDPATPLGFTPLPGAQRLLSSRELGLIARQHGIEIGDGQVISSVCVERQVRPLAREDIQSALVQALGLPDIKIEVIEFSNQPLPLGRLEFPIAGLNKPSASMPQSPVIWRGQLVYDHTRSASIWAKVRLEVERTWFVAAENIPAGTTIRSEQLRAASGPEFPFQGPSFGSAESIVGKVARRNISAGQRILPSAVEEPADVTKGQKVRVQVIDGLASLSLECVAESSGKKGDSVLVHNPVSGRNFRAVIEDQGLVVVRSSTGT
jgi:flagella basal body P-ring formation protein FlgA